MGKGELSIDKRKGVYCFICGRLKRENKNISCYRSNRHYYGRKSTQLKERGMLKCKLCKEIKPLKEFYMHCGNSKPRPTCKKCYLAYNKENNYHDKWILRNPWFRHYASAYGRCNGIDGKKHIKFNMTPEDFKVLWFRDKAHLLKQASIDRIDNKGHYDVRNCRFIELSENSSKGIRTLEEFMEYQRRKILK